MEKKEVFEAVVKKDPEHEHVDRCIKLLKYLIELGNNDNDECVGRKEAYRFLYEVTCYREEYGDDHVVPELREAIKKNEEFLKINNKIKFRAEPAQWLVDGLKPPPQFRDNEKTECREMFDDENKHWTPIFDFKTREKLACNYCQCSECQWETSNRSYHCLSAPRTMQRKRHAPANSDKSDVCSKHKFYLPFVERDDDEGYGYEY